MCGDHPLDKSSTQTYHSPIMASDRFRRRIDRLMDQIEAEADQRDWLRVREFPRMCSWPMVGTPTLKTS